VAAMQTQVVCDPEAPNGRIVATIGPPDSVAYPDLERLLGFGTIRINLSFAGPDNYEQQRALVRRIRAQGGDRICVLLDCVGPRVKLGPLPRAGIELHEGAEITITTREVESGGKLLHTVFELLPRFVQPGDPVLMAEGRLRMDVVATDGKQDVRCKVIRGGLLKKRGLNLPETELPVPALSERDRIDLEAMLEEDVDMIALSFVRGVADLVALREFLDARGKTHIRIMAKIETRQAVAAIKDVAKHCDALMVARGDLWAELANPWEIPRVTTRIIRAGDARGIPVVTATQTLSSMTERDVPSRAEVDELYFLLQEGSDAIMGSEEFAIGLHPEAVVHAIRAVSREVDLERASMPALMHRVDAQQPFDRESAAIAWAEHTDRVRCVVAISDHGGNAHRIYRRRQRKPLVVITNTPATARYLQLFGVRVVLMDYRREDVDHHQIVQDAMRALGWHAPDQTALLVVRHHSGTRRFSKIEEIELPD
jgi:pyruvate kinase